MSNKTEQNKKKQAYMKAAGYKVPQDGSWGPWQQKIYDKLSKEEIEIQKQTISKFLPKMLSNDEIKQIISSLEDKSIPAVMKYFKANYDGQVDMGLVNKIARNG